jgi:hypothetical protein
MALKAKSLDEEVTELADSYDNLIQPEKIWRNHNNKLYLALRAFGAGKVGLTDAALALHNRFDPLLCDELDLRSMAKITGTEPRQGTGSIVDITITNKDTEESKLFAAGVYGYRSAAGTVFSLEMQDDYEFDPAESRVVSAISAEKGSFPVTQSADIQLFRLDEADIDSAFVFSCEDNSGMLGYPDETLFDFRMRILNSADRQDHIKELELKIRNLPNIFECNLVFNSSTFEQEYDGITLAARELLIMITGVPTNKIAELVVRDVLYQTHAVDPGQVVYYYNDLYAGGRYPVYFKYHDKTEFSLAITYRYDPLKIKPLQVEKAVRELFMPYTKAVTHMDIFGEEIAYKTLSGLNLPNTQVLNINVHDGEGIEVPYITVPKTRLLHLTGITFTAVEQDT